MSRERNPYAPECFGDLSRVFPMGDDGLRHTPDNCLTCAIKTECLRAAMDQTDDGLKAREEFVDRAYDAGMMGFLERWSRKKTLQKRLEQSEKTRGERSES